MAFSSLQGAFVAGAAAEPLSRLDMLSATPPPLYAFAAGDFGEAAFEDTMPGDRRSRARRLIDYSLRIYFAESAPASMSMPGAGWGSGLGAQERVRFR